jgi:hypothetical protein
VNQNRANANTNVEELLRLLRLGLWIIPNWWPLPNGGCACGKPDCKDQGKHPCLPTWKMYQQQPPTEADIIAWHDTFPRANWGAILGRGPGLIAADLDAANAEQLLHDAGVDLPLSPTAAGARGKKVFLRWEMSCRPRIGFLEHVDILGIGSQAIIPPSTHKTGISYTWLVDPAAGFADVPQALLDLLALRQAERMPGGTRPVRTPLQTTATIDEGERNGSLASMAGSMRRRGMSHEAIEAALLAENAQRCSPPLEDAEVRKIAASIARYPAGAGTERRCEPADGNRACVAAPRGGDQPIPQIDAGDHDLARVSEAAWSALIAANDPPVHFRFGTVPSRIEMDDEGMPVVRALDQDRLRHALARNAQWYVLRKSVEVPALPPLHVVRDMLARPNSPLPILTRIVSAPVFASDGTLQTKPGYDPATRAYFAPAAGLVIPPVPATPTDTEIARAKGWLLEDLLGDFPFVGDPERAHMLSLILLPFVREFIVGPTPLHLVEKPAPGTGATLMIEASMSIATGREVGLMTEAREEEEWRKRVTAQLREGPSVVVIDNLRRLLDSAAVASALTTTVWEDRLLGGNVMARLPVRCAWIATGNNASLSNEIARRTVRIRLDARMEKPWLRKVEEFRHPAIKLWAKEHRGELIWAALVLASAWVAAGRPSGHGGLGMFESWSAVMGGILDVIDVPGFLGNLPEFYEGTNAESAGWEGLVSAWWDEYQDRAVGVSDLWTLMRPAHGNPPDLGLEDGSEKSQRTQFGLRLSRMRDCRVASWRIVQGGKYHGAQLWKLQFVR